MRKLLLGAVAAAAIAMVAGAAQASVILNHEDAGGSFRTFRGADSAPVGRLTVSSSQTIEGFGVDVDLNGDTTLDFLIFNSDSGALLYSSGATAFADTGAGYKYSNPFSFTFDVGVTYGLAAISAAGGNYFVDAVANSVGGFNFLTDNQNVSGHTLQTGLNCCDVGTSLVVGNGAAAVPEPASWALMIGGFGLAGAALRRRRALVAA
jgi:hypothetical protein